MVQKSILITGCSSGIGYDAAHTLHKQGWKVFATCRGETDCERLRSEGLQSLRLDYQDETTLDTVLTEILEQTGGTLDAVFNNGAYAIPGAVEDLSRGALEDIFSSNLFGQITLTNRIIPIMRQQGYGRIIFNSSVLGFVSTPFRGAYCATKFALEAFVDAYRLEHNDSPLDFVLIEPGPIATAFRDNAAKQFEKWIDWENAHRRDYYEQAVRKRLYDKSTKKDRFELESSAVTKKLLHALEAQKPRRRYFVTTPTYAVSIFKRFLPTSILDKIMARQ